MNSPCVCFGLSVLLARLSVFFARGHTTIWHYPDRCTIPRSVMTRCDFSDISMIQWTRLVAKPVPGGCVRCGADVVPVDGHTQSLIHCSPCISAGQLLWIQRLETDRSLSPRILLSGGETGIVSCSIGLPGTSRKEEEKGVDGRVGFAAHRTSN